MHNLLSKLVAALKPSRPDAFPTRLDNLEVLVRGAKCTPGGAVIIVADEAMRGKAFDLSKQIQIGHKIEGRMFVLVATSLGTTNLAEYGVPVMIHTDVITLMVNEPCQRCAELQAQVKLATGQLSKAEQRCQELYALINSPSIDDFLESVRREAAHQVQRWQSAHDAGKQDSDWYWLLGYLGGKLINRPNDPLEKQLHWIISIAAACFNWWRAKTGEDRRMRPGTMRAGDE